MSSEFEKLAAELEVLAKAQPATEDDKVLAAAKEAGVDADQVGDTKTPDATGNADADAAGVADDDEDEDEDEEVLGKSFQVVGGDGTPVTAYDATDLIKSLNDRVSALESGHGNDEDRREHLGKSLTLITDLIKSQAGEIQALKATVESLGKQGAGRKAVLTVTERPDTMTKSVQPPSMNTESFMMKANAAYNAGRITGKDLTVCDVSLRHKEPIDAALIQKIFAD